MPDIFAITSLGRRTGVKNNTLWAGINTLSPSNWTITPRSGTDDQFTYVEHHDCFIVYFTHLALSRITNATEGYWTAPSVPNAQVRQFTTYAVIYETNDHFADSNSKIGGF